MGNTNVNIRMDSALKAQFEEFCADMGLSMSAAFNVFAKKAVREYRIPFEIGAEIPNAITVAAMNEAEQIAKDPNSKKYDSFVELCSELMEDV